MTEYAIKDSGTRTSFGGGMVRDGDAADKVDYTSILFGPMAERWAVHCTKGRVKYPDSEPGVPNWTLASGVEEYLHARGSLLRHLMAYLRGETDEDHAAAIMFNINLMEYIRDKLPEGQAPSVFPDQRVRWIQQARAIRNPEDDPGGLGEDVPVRYREPGTPPALQTGDWDVK